MTGCYVISTCAFLITSIVHLMNRRAYHPIFSFLFLLLLAVYVFSNSLNVAEFVIVHLVTGIVIYIKLDLMKRDHLLEEILQFAISMIIIVMLVFLLYMNVRLTQLLQGGNGRLSTRYQLIENIKILRLLVPVVVFDTTVCAVDLIGAVFFNIQPAFNKIDCSNSAFYLPAYFVFRLVSYDKLLL
ncbi:hypothetical protein RB195_016658 [Necator americanus]|uniref:7TM GPCR serpentine receptor class x (Srx) domain-containing protein n=1 Tax=Necator americanus TaxID=51031 RepID=A0ABR1C324_NECAM